MRTMQPEAIHKLPLPLPQHCLVPIRKKKCNMDESLMIKIKMPKHYYK